MAEHSKEGAPPTAAPTRSEGSVATPGRSSLVESAEGGESLPEGPRRRYEATLGVGLGNVRVHKGPKADRLASDVNAAAFAHGNHIYMGEGRDPNDPANDRVLAEEVAHTVQQRGAAPADKPKTTQPGDAAESEANTAADAMVDGKSASVSSQPAAIARHGGKGGKKDGKDSKDDLPTPEKDDTPESEKQEVDHFEQSWFYATKFEKEKGGPLTTEDAGDRVIITSPEIVATSTAMAMLPKGMKFGSKSVKVGPIQTLMSSTRTGIYEKDQKRTETTAKMGRVRDVAPVTNDAQRGAKSTFAKTNEGPFYSGNPDTKVHIENKGKPLDQKNQAGEAPTAGLSELNDGALQAQVAMIDQPKHSLPKEVDGAKLVGMKGSDEFNTSAGFKTSDGQVFGKAPFGWRLSWDRTINVAKPQAEQQAKPGEKPKDAIEEFEAKEAIIEDTKLYAVELGNIMSVDDAYAKGPTWLIENLPKAREASPEKATLMEQGLARHTLSISVTVLKSCADAEKPLDDVNVEISPSITKVASTTMTGKFGSPVIARQSIGALADLKSLTMASMIGVAVHENTSSWGRTVPLLGGTCTLPLPDGAATEPAFIDEGNCRYKVTAKWG